MGGTLTTDGYANQLLAKHLFADADPQSPDNKSRNIDTSHRRALYGFFFFFGAVVASFTALWGHGLGIEALRYLEVGSDVSVVNVQSCFVAYGIHPVGRAEEEMLGFGTTKKSQSATDNKTVLTIDGTWSRQCYVLLDIQPRTSELTIQLDSSTLLLQGSPDQANLVLPFDLTVKDIDRGTSSSAAGSVEPRASRVQLKNVLPLKLTVRMRDGTVVVDLPRIKATDDLRGLSPSISVGLAFGSVFLGVRDRSDKFPTYALISANVEAESYCYDTAAVTEPLLQRTENRTKFDALINPGVAPSGTPQLTVAVFATSVYILPNQNSSASDLVGGTATAQPARFSPDAQRALIGTQEFLKDIKKSQHLQNLKIVSPLGGALILETSNKVLIQVGLNNLNIISGFALSPARRYFSSSLSHYQCNVNVTQVTPYLSEPSSLISLLLDRENQNNADYFRFMSMGVIFSLLRDTERFARNFSVDLVSTSVFSRADLEVGIESDTPVTRTYRILNKSNEFELAYDTQINPAQLSVLLISQALGFAVMVLVAFFVIVNLHGQLLDFFFFGHSRARIRAHLKIAHGDLRVPYHLYSSLYQLHSAISFLIVQRIYWRVFSARFIQSFLTATFERIPVIKRDEYPRIIPVSDICAEFCVWSTRLFSEVSSLPEKEMRAAILDDSSSVQVGIEQRQTKMVRGVSMVRTNTDADAEVIVADLLVVTGKLFDEVPLPTIINEADLQGLKDLTANGAERLISLLKKTRGVKMEDCTVECAVGLEWNRLLLNTNYFQEQSLAAAIVAETTTSEGDPLANVTTNMDRETLLWVEEAFASFAGIETLIGAGGTTAPSRKCLINPMVMVWTVVQRFVHVVVLFAAPVALVVVVVAYYDVAGSISSVSSYPTSPMSTWPLLRVPGSKTYFLVNICVILFYVVAFASVLEPLTVLMFRLISKDRLVRIGKNVQIEYWFRNIYSSFVFCVWVSLNLIFVWYVSVIAFWLILSAILTPQEMLAYGTAAFAFVATITTALSTLKNNREAVIERLKARMVEEMVELIKSSSASLADAASSIAGENAALSMGILIDAAKGNRDAMEVIAEACGAPPAVLSVVMAVTKKDLKAIKLAVRDVSELARLPKQFDPLLTQVLMRALGQQSSDGQLLRAACELIPHPQLRRAVDEMQPLISAAVQSLTQASGDQSERATEMLNAAISIVLNQLRNWAKKELQALMNKAQAVAQQKAMELIAKANAAKIPGAKEVDSKALLDKANALLTDKLIDNGSKTLQQALTFLTQLTPSAINSFLDVLKSSARTFDKKEFVLVLGRLLRSAQPAILELISADSVIHLMPNVHGCKPIKLRDVVELGIDLAVEFSRQIAGEPSNFRRLIFDFADDAFSLTAGIESIKTRVREQAANLRATATDVVEKADAALDKPLADAAAAVNAAAEKVDQTVAAATDEAHKVAMTAAGHAGAAAAAVHSGAQQINGVADKVNAVSGKVGAATSGKLELRKTSAGASALSKSLATVAAVAKFKNLAGTTQDQLKAALAIKKTTAAVTTKVQEAVSGARASAKKAAIDLIKEQTAELEIQSIGVLDDLLQLLKGGSMNEVAEAAMRRMRGTVTKMSESNMLGAAMRLVKLSVARQPPLLKKMMRVIFEMSSEAEVISFLASDADLGKLYTQIAAATTDNVAAAALVEISHVKMGFWPKVRELLQIVTDDKSRQKFLEEFPHGVKTHLLVRWTANFIWHVKAILEFSGGDFPKSPQELVLSAGDIDQLSSLTGVPEPLFYILTDIISMAQTMLSHAPGASLIAVIAVLLNSEAVSSLLPGADALKLIEVAKRWIPDAASDRAEKFLQALQKGKVKEEDLERLVDDIGEMQVEVSESALLTTGFAAANAAIADATGVDVQAAGEEMQNIVNPMDICVPLLLRMVVKKGINADLSGLLPPAARPRVATLAEQAEQEKSMRNLRQKCERDIGELLIATVVGDTAKALELRFALGSKLLVEVCHYACPMGDQWDINHLVQVAQAALSQLEAATVQKVDPLSIDYNLASRNLRLSPNHLRFLTDVRAALKSENVISNFIFSMSGTHPGLNAPFSVSDAGYQALLSRIKEMDPAAHKFFGTSNHGEEKNWRSPQRLPPGKRTWMCGQDERLKFDDGEYKFEYHTYEQDVYISDLDAILFCSHVRAAGACRKCRMYRTMITVVNELFLAPEDQRPKKMKGFEDDFFMLFIDMIRTSTPIFWKYICNSNQLALDLGLSLEALAATKGDVATLRTTVLELLEVFLGDANIIDVKKSKAEGKLVESENFLYLCDTYFDSLPEDIYPRSVLDYAMKTGDAFALLLGRLSVFPTLRHFRGLAAEEWVEDPDERLDDWDVIEISAIEFFGRCHGLEYPVPPLRSSFGKRKGAEPHPKVAEPGTPECAPEAYQALCTFLVRKANTPSSAMSRLIAALGAGVRRLAVDMARFRFSGFYKTLPALSSKMEEVGVGGDKAPGFVHTLTEVLQGAVTGEDIANIFYDADAPELEEYSVGTTWMPRCLRNAHMHNPYIIGVSDKNVKSEGEASDKRVRRAARARQVMSLAKIVIQGHLLPLLITVPPYVSPAEPPEAEKALRLHFRLLKTTVMMQALIRHNTYKNFLVTHDPELPVGRERYSSGFGLTKFSDIQVELEEKQDPVRILFGPYGKLWLTPHHTVSGSCDNEPPPTVTTTGAAAAAAASTTSKTDPSLMPALARQCARKKMTRAQRNALLRQEATVRVAAVASSLIQISAECAENRQVFHTRMEKDIEQGVSPYRLFFAGKFQNLCDFGIGFLSRDPEMIESGLSRIITLLESLNMRIDNLTPAPTGMHWSDSLFSGPVMEHVVKGVCCATFEIIVHRAKMDSEAGQGGNSAVTKVEAREHLERLCKYAYKPLMKFLFVVEAKKRGYVDGDYLATKLERFIEIGTAGWDSKAQLLKKFTASDSIEMARCFMQFMCLLLKQGEPEEDDEKREERERMEQEKEEKRQRKRDERRKKKEEARRQQKEEARKKKEAEKELKKKKQKQQSQNKDEGDDDDDEHGVEQQEEEAEEEREDEEGEEDYDDDDDDDDDESETEQPESKHGEDEEAEEEEDYDELLQNEARLDENSSGTSSDEIREMLLSLAKMIGKGPPSARAVFKLLDRVLYIVSKERSSMRGVSPDRALEIASAIAPVVLRLVGAPEPIIRLLHDPDRIKKAAEDARRQAERAVATGEQLVVRGKETGNALLDWLDQIKKFPPQERAMRCGLAVLEALPKLAELLGEADEILQSVGLNVPGLGQAAAAVSGAHSTAQNTIATGKAAYAQAQQTKAQVEQQVALFQIQAAQMQAAAQAQMAQMQQQASLAQQQGQAFLQNAQTQLHNTAQSAQAQLQGAKTKLEKTAQAQLQNAATMIQNAQMPTLEQYQQSAPSAAQLQQHASQLPNLLTQQIMQGAGQLPNLALLQQQLTAGQQQLMQMPMQLQMQMAPNLQMLQHQAAQMQGMLPPQLAAQLPQLHGTMQLPPQLAQMQQMMAPGLSQFTNLPGNLAHMQQQALQMVPGKINQMQQQLQELLPPNLVPLLTNLYELSRGNYEVALPQLLGLMGVETSSAELANLVRVLSILKKMCSDKKLAGVALESAKQMATDAALTALTDFIFTEFDKEGTGLLSFNSFRAIIARMRLSLPLQEQRALFLKADTDGSGMIDKKEFMAILGDLRMLLQNEVMLSIGLNPENITAAVIILGILVLMLLTFVLLGIVALGGTSQFDAVIGAAVPFATTQLSKLGNAGVSFERAIAAAEAAAVAVMKRMRSLT